MGAFDKEAYILTGYFNLMKMLDLALHDGFDVRTGKYIGARTGDPASFATFDGRPNTKDGAYRPEMLPTTCHVYFGEVCLASADGRGEGQPVSEGISPVQGADRHGPNAVLWSRPTCCARPRPTRAPTGI